MTCFLGNAGVSQELTFLGGVKTLESFEGLPERPAVAVLVRKYGAVLMSDLSRQTCQAVQAFDESSTFMGGVKTLESFEGLLERPAMAVVVRKCGAVLMSDLTLDLRRVRTCPDTSV